MLLLMKTLNQEIKLPSKNKEINRRCRITYWPTSKKEAIQWFPFLGIMEYNADNIETQITLLPLLLEKNQCFRCVFGMINKNIEENVVENITIRCNWFVYEKYEYQLQIHNQ